MISGTPTHISPEQTMGKQLDAQSDLYSLAIIGFQLLTARLPFQGEGMMDLLYAHVHTSVPAPTSINPALPAPVDAVMLRALAKDPTQRYASAAEMMGSLEAAGAGRVDERRPRPATETVVVPPEPERRVAGQQAPPEPTTVGRPSRRAPWVIAGALVLLLLVGALGYTYLPGLLAGNGVGGLPTPGASRSPGAGTPTPVVIKRLEVKPVSPLKMGTPITVSGRGLDPRRSASAGVLQSGQVHPVSAGMTVQSDGAFSVDGIVPTDLAPGAAALVACNFDSRGQTDLTQCLQLNVTIIR
jgi:hypothetical protein